VHHRLSGRCCKWPVGAECCTAVGHKIMPISRELQLVGMGQSQFLESDHGRKISSAIEDQNIHLLGDHFIHPFELLGGPLHLRKPKLDHPSSSPSQYSPYHPLSSHHAHLNANCKSQGPGKRSQSDFLKTTMVNQNKRTHHTIGGSAGYSLRLTETKSTWYLPLPRPLGKLRVQRSQ
jgi:hypothetical protein